MDENKKIEIIDYYANNISVNTSMFECGWNSERKL